MTFAEKAERILIVVMVISILVLTLSPRVLWLYQVALGFLLTATFLQIAVGNLPREASMRRSMKIIAIILTLIAVVFGLGILLVPVFSNLGN